MLKPEIFGFMNEMLAKVPDEGRLIKQLYSNNIRMIGYDARDKKKQWAGKAGAREKLTGSRVQKTFEENRD